MTEVSRLSIASSIKKSVVFNCVACRNLIGKMGVQIMADIPKGRFQEAAPFTYCAVDMFELFKIKINEVK